MPAKGSYYKVTSFPILPFARGIPLPKKKGKCLKLDIQLSFRVNMKMWYKLLVHSEGLLRYGPSAVLFLNVIQLWPSLRSAWIKQVRREDSKPSTYSYVCSYHFREEETLTPAQFRKSTLKPGAIPKYNLRGEAVDERIPRRNSRTSTRARFNSPEQVDVEGASNNKLTNNHPSW